MAAEESYLSRFFVKFIEISAAGVATAVSGYVLAHLTGYTNSPQPAAVQPPAALQSPAAPVTVPAAAVATPPSTPPVASAPAASPAAPPQRAATTPPQQDSKSTALRKSLPAEKPADTANAAAPDGKIRDVTDTKPRSAESIEAEVRAALAKVDAGHPGKGDKQPDAGAEAKADAKPETKPDTKPEAIAPRRPVTQPDVAARTPEPKPRPVEASTGMTATAPRMDAPQRPAAMTPPPQPVQQAVAQPQAPMQIAPQTATPAMPVEIKSMPVAGVDSSAQPGAQAGAEAAAEPQHRGLFSVFSSERLRNDKPLPADQAPRPPGDIGQ